jgi:hypothetical protein
MATQRRSTALFEVINRGQRSGNTGALSTPKWWFKSKVASSSAVAPPAHSAPAASTAASPHSASDAGSQYFRSRNRSAIHFDFDRDRQEITINMRYTTAIVSAFAILVAVGLAYTVGRRIATGPTLAYASLSTDQLLHIPADPSAMDVRQQTSSPTPAPAGVSHFAPLSAAGDGTAIAPAPVASRTSMEINQPRSVGLNYIIVQSYNTEKLADEARDFLIKNNVPCTVEKISNFFTVISSTGYSHIHSPEFENAIRNITALGEQFGGKTKFKRFDPYGYKWKATSTS